MQLSSYAQCSVNIPNDLDDQNICGYYFLGLLQHIENVNVNPGFPNVNPRHFEIRGKIALPRSNASKRYNQYRHWLWVCNVCPDPYVQLRKMEAT